MKKHAAVRFWPLALLFLASVATTGCTDLDHSPATADVASKQQAIYGLDQITFQPVMGDLGLISAVDPEGRSVGYFLYSIQPDGTTMDAHMIEVNPEYRDLGKGTQQGGLGTRLLRATLERHPNVTAFEGQLAMTNLDVFEDAMSHGLSPQAAMKQTPTARGMARFGFQLDPNAYIDRFTPRLRMIRATLTQIGDDVDEITDIMGTRPGLIFGFGHEASQFFQALAASLGNATLFRYVLTLAPFWEFLVSLEAAGVAITANIVMPAAIAMAVAYGFFAGLADELQAQQAFGHAFNAGCQQDICCYAAYLRLAGGDSKAILLGYAMRAAFNGGAIIGDPAQIDSCKATVRNAICPPVAQALGVAIDQCNFVPQLSDPSWQVCSCQAPEWLDQDCFEQKFAAKVDAATAAMDCDRSCGGNCPKAACILTANGSPAPGAYLCTRVCGLNGCESGETCQSCPADCGQCPSTCQYKDCKGVCNGTAVIDECGVCGGGQKRLTCDGKECGTWPDGCGGTMTCGSSCTAPDECNSQGQCECVAVWLGCSSDQCGTVLDKCGGPHDCGSCNCCDDMSCNSAAEWVAGGCVDACISKCTSSGYGSRDCSIWCGAGDPCSCDGKSCGADDGCGNACGQWNDPGCCDASCDGKCGQVNGCGDYCGDCPCDPTCYSCGTFSGCGDWCGACCDQNCYSCGTFNGCGQWCGSCPVQPCGDWNCDNIDDCDGGPGDCDACYECWYTWGMSCDPYTGECIS